MDVSIEYAWSQLVAAERTSSAHADPAVRDRAAAEVARWRAVLAGMRDGSIAVGSRTPTAAPAWVTLEVVTGGFATGGYHAGGPLAPWEVALAAALRVPATRLALNLAHLEGRAAELLASGAYRIDVPEEGALLVVAWLRAHGLDGSGPLLAILAPWMHALRFYPRPADGPRPLARGVRLQDVGPTVDGLDVARRQTRLEAQHAALQVWTPLRDRAMALLAATVDGPLPRLVDGAVHGAALGGRRPTGWDAEVAALAAEVRRAGAPPTRRAREVAGVVDRLARGADDRDALAADASLRRALACYVTAHGAPGSAALAARRADEARAVAAPLHKTLRRALVDRLSALPRDGGLALEDVMAPLDATEAARFRVPPGAALPSYFAAKVARSWDAPLDTLVDRGVIPSAEELARVVQQVTAQVRAVAFADPTARALYTALYAAFRARRGLLLLHYQHQVRLEEVPWIATLVARAGEPAALHDVATAVFSQVGAAAVRGFPHTIMPNKLIVELAALAGTAPTRPPFVEELAADIFMGSFTEKFAKSARLAAEVFTGTLYARYFAIDARAVATLPTSGRLADAFAALCRDRAARIAPSLSGVAGNGAIIEQSQILTTHNLALVFAQPAARAALAPELGALAERTWRWIVRELRIPTRTRHEALIRRKNAAYAWRQLVFYLALSDRAAAFGPWARAQVATVDGGLAARLAPYLRGLELAAAGVASDDPAFAAAGARVFTGWATGDLAAG